MRLRIPSYAADAAMFTDEETEEIREEAKEIGEGRITVGLFQDPAEQAPANNFRKALELCQSTKLLC